MYNEITNMSDEQARKEIEIIDSNLDILTKEELRLEGKKRKGLRWWFLLPIFGFIVYIHLVNKRGENPEFREPLNKIKTDIMTHEFKKLMLKKKLGELDNVKN
ncbi:hypothetical protein [Spiroplasma endosymbiont of Othius punctulatus]|uniref:hypothetical protein n=1 Tax=Spiroplasma endosymbiont of Othius punctulatus TaxID=3066289 RepID=UPI0030D2F142